VPAFHGAPGSVFSFFRHSSPLLNPVPGFLSSPLCLGFSSLPYPPIQLQFGRTWRVAGIHEHSTC
jgi:hypothetical protein